MVCLKHLLRFHGGLIKYLFYTYLSNYFYKLSFVVESKSFTSWTRVNLQPGSCIVDLNMVLRLLEKNTTSQVDLVLTQISYGNLGLQQTLF